jgi:hypothetical protein
MVAVGGHPQTVLIGGPFPRLADLSCGPSPNHHDHGVFILVPPAECGNYVIATTDPKAHRPNGRMQVHRPIAGERN